MDELVYLTTRVSSICVTYTFLSCLITCVGFILFHRRDSISLVNMRGLCFLPNTYCRPSSENLNPFAQGFSGNKQQYNYPVWQRRSISKQCNIVDVAITCYLLSFASMSHATWNRTKDGKSRKSGWHSQHLRCYPMSTGIGFPKMQYRRSVELLPPFLQKSSASEVGV